MDAAAVCSLGPVFDAGSLWGDGGLDAPCMSNDDCDGFAYWCQKYGACSGAGRCASKSAAAGTAFYVSPVCGCNGLTYFSPNETEEWFVNYTSGACTTAPCMSDSDCCQTSPDGFRAPASFCLKPVGQCGGAGMCVVPPETSCGPNPGPQQCGCDGKIYSAACTLYGARQNSKGEPLAGDGGFYCP
jgi:hypothetical protein